MKVIDATYAREQPVPASHQLVFHKLFLGCENYITQMNKLGLTENTPFALKFFLSSGQAEPSAQMFPVPTHPRARVLSLRC